MPVLNVNGTGIDFAFYEVKAKDMSLAELHFAVRDCEKTARMWPGELNESLYHDEGAVYSKELRKRLRNTDREVQQLWVAAEEMFEWISRLPEQHRPHRSVELEWLKAISEIR